MKLNQMIGSIFECDDARLKDTDTANDIEAWDSVTHILLLSAIEEEFHIKFSDAEMSEIETIGQIREAVAARRGVAVSDV